MTNKLRRLLPLTLCLLPLAAGCRQDMHDAPRYDPLEASPVFSQGASSRELVEGTVARGQLGGDVFRLTGQVDGQPATEYPFAMTRADLDRGEERFNAFCAPCHGRTGEGEGMVVQRGYRQPSSFHLDRLRQAPPGYFFDVITNGFGVMPDYRAQVPVDDRWRIAAYVRVLQLSQRATAADLPPGEFDTVTARIAAEAAAAAAPAEGDPAR